MKVEERAKTVTDEVGTATTGAELRALITKALREQIEECAKVAKAIKEKELRLLDLKTCCSITAGEIEEAIRALAEPKETEGKGENER